MVFGPIVLKTEINCFFFDNSSTYRDYSGGLFDNSTADTSSNKYLFATLYQREGKHENKR